MQKCRERPLFKATAPCTCASRTPIKALFSLYTERLAIILQNKLDVIAIVSYFENVSPAVTHVPNFFLL